MPIGWGNSYFFTAETQRAPRKPFCVSTRILRRFHTALYSGHFVAI